MVRMTARGRLATLYTGLVFAAGVVLIALTYFLVRRGMQHRFVLFGRTANGEPLPTPTPDLAAIRSAERLREDTVTQLLTQSTIALAVVTALAAVLGWLIAGRLLRPIRAISATAQRLSAENLAERVPVNKPDDELAALAGTINGMLDRIESGIADRDRLLQSQRMFVANAAHELRTPLATMRTAIDVTLDGTPTRDELLAMAADVNNAVVQSQRTLDGLLVLARSQAGPTKHAPLDLADIFGAALVGIQGLTLHTDLKPAPMRGEPVLIERMAGNLVDNAVRYNETGGTITVATGVTATQAFVRITNTGQHIAPDDAARLFEPFVRAGASRQRADRSGTGLGLSIVRAIVTAHGGTVACTAPDSGGLDLTVHFVHAQPPEEP
ncbi:sensor histidine kinase [Allorhizocola rhizosphaerae]|uniref:sensor histidine kinase n=1 Tax=Allorhizocola rhizosphaerae TaxID=1872709 RepID=UPI001B8D4A29|nr:HAMP domain-containing sensor histidine kinase [Allorhizocola rhizosphaerae]